MKTLDNILVFSFLTLVLCTGCKKKDTTPVVVPDTTKPIITITSPTAGQTFIVGNTIPFQASFSDNELLKTYEITISKVITSGYILKNVPTPVAWSYSKSATSFNTGVKQQPITLSDITIPTMINTSAVATGKYNFKVTCIDGSNNSSETILEININ
ncbi:MAG: DUF4625 domain-containing protein [Mariniphaga sp.]